MPVPGTATTLTDHGTVLLPEHLRLPDLSLVRTVTGDDLATCLNTAREAAAWGPDQRNGCTRIHEPHSDYLDWRDQQGRPHSPDRHTPTACATIGTAYWYHRGPYTHPVPGQPAVISANSLIWITNSRRHRPDGPCEITTHPNLTDLPWSWHGLSAEDDLADLLTRAWTAHHQDDNTALHLLDQAKMIRPSPLLQVRPDQWIAHVITANPHARLTPRALGWLALLAA